MTKINTKKTVHEEEKAGTQEIIADIMASTQPEPVEEIDLNRIIKVMSVTYGRLTYKAKVNGLPFVWNERGDIKPMKMSDIIDMYSSAPAFLKNPFVVLLDPQAVEYMRLTEIYKNIPTEDKLTELFSGNLEEARTAIDKYISAGMRDVFVFTARAMYDKKKLNDINVIRMLEDKLQFMFSMD